MTHHRTLTACGPWLALFALAGCADAPAPAPVSSGSPAFYRSLAAADAKVDAESARDMISEYRRNHGLGPIALDSTLERAAAGQSAAMAAADKLSHEVRGPLGARLTAAGAKSGLAVENVSAGYHTMAEAFSGWRDSPPHNRNLLEPGVKRMGIATAYAPGTRYKVFWTLVMTD